MNLKSISRDPDLFTKSDVWSIRNLIFGLDFIFLPLQLSFEQKPRLPTNELETDEKGWVAFSKQITILIDQKLEKCFHHKKRGEARHINIKEDLESQICEIEIAPHHQSCENNFSKVSIFQTRNCILLPKLFWPTVRKNCSSDREKLLKFEASPDFQILRRPCLSSICNRKYL